MNPAVPELWAGLECTVNRVGEEYIDQLQLSGHAGREEDIALFASMGISKMRYPLLWELTAPQGLDTADWSWADRRLKLLQEHQITPIIGLVHHGSGPRYTSLADPGFAEGVEAYARAVAERYPWLEYFTPVNEPLTTARFSGLYGFWYPHGKDGYTFGLTLLHQCKAIVLAMRAIREVIPHAKLVQTEDLGKTYSTPGLAYQANWDNERRWLSLDLLTGNLGPDSAMWNFFAAHGIPEADLQWFCDNLCPPDIIGINHYPTSERYLDENLENFPEWSHGGNVFQQFADVEAVRVKTDDPKGLYTGHEVLLREAWERYAIPLAVTEVHIGGHREEQVRWFKHAWDSCVILKREGVNVVGVTAWSLLGSFDWNSLVTRCDGCYEPGVFDVRGESPRPTATAKMLRQLAQGKSLEHPLFHTPGWWQRQDRFFYPFSEIAREQLSGPFLSSSTRPVLITGASGTLGRAFARICTERHIPFQLLDRQQLNITDPLSIEKAIERYKPWAVINAAGYVRVDEAENDAQTCLLVNANGATFLSEACQKRNIQYLTFSSDLVFDGLKQQPYVEKDTVNPLNVYGKSKAQSEKDVLGVFPCALVVRTSSFFGPWDNFNFLTVMANELVQGNPFFSSEDTVISATYVPDLVHACLDLLVDEESGIWHLTNEGEISWTDLARKGAERLHLDTSLIQGVSSSELQHQVACRPRYSAMRSERGTLLPPLEDAIVRYADSMRHLSRIALLA